MKAISDDRLRMPLCVLKKALMGGPLSIFNNSLGIRFEISDGDRARIRDGIEQAVNDAGRSLKKRDFDFYLRKFSSEVRLNGLLAIEGLLTDAEYWPLLSGVWQTAETIHHAKRHWKRLLFCNRPYRQMMMNDAERKELAAMPDTLTIYRGFTHKGGWKGFSWTLDRKRADFFATLGNGLRREIYGLAGGRMRSVATAKCCKGDVTALFNGRKEAEIVIDPMRIELIETADTA